MANFISISRIFITFISLYLLTTGTMKGFVAAAILVVIQFALDGVDGYVARKLNEESKFGSVLDIISDRIAENAYWIVFAAFGWIPLTFPMIALTRTVIVDNLRSVAMENNCTAFGECSMQKDPVGKFICCSKFMRIFYATVKALGFVCIIISSIPMIDFGVATTLYFYGAILVTIAILLCVLRGFPVVLESKQFFVKKEVVNEQV